jgi:hypothetical protein
MCKRLVLVVAMLLGACGTESTSPAGSGDSNPPAGPGGGAAPVAPLLDATITTNVKVVLKTTRLVDVPVTIYDGATDSSVGVPCTADAQCAAFPGATCKNLACTTTASVNSILYVRNFARAAATISVPCDGRLYTAEVYGAGTPAPGGPFAITESHISAPFTMLTTCATPAVDWTSVTPTNPSFIFPTIYAGLGAPYDTYNVQVQDLAYPWSRDHWSLTYGGQDTIGHPTRYSGASATFDSPASTATLNFTGLFHLHSSLLVGDDTATSWELKVAPLPGQTPFGSGSVPLP